MTDQARVGFIGLGLMGAPMARNLIAAGHSVAVWNRSAASHEALLKALQDWCQQAEATGVRALQEFSQRLKGYSLQPA